MIFNFYTQTRGRETTIFEPYTLCPIGVFCDLEFGDYPIGNSTLYFDGKQQRESSLTGALITIAIHYKKHSLNSYYQDKIILENDLIERAMNLIIINSCKDVQDFLNKVSLYYHNINAMLISPLLVRIAFKRLIDTDQDPNHQYYDFIDRSSFNTELNYRSHEIDI